MDCGTTASRRARSCWFARGKIGAVDMHFRIHHRQHPAQRADERGLARSVRTDQRQNAPGGQLKADIPEHRLAGIAG